MRLSRSAAALALALIVSLPAAGDAHVFLQPYALPVPFWLYLYAAAATLILSFAVLGVFVGAAPAPWIYRTTNVLPGTGASQTAWKWIVMLLRVVGVGCLVLTLAAGIVGSSDPRSNINMTLFWVVFLLGLTYLTAIVGNIYEFTNPWRSLVDAAEKLGVDLSKSRVSYPAALGYLPAFALYVGLVWIELFTFPRPYLLSLLATLYTAVTFLAVLLFGKQTWFEYGELFSVFFRVIGAMAPVEYAFASEGRPARICVRLPFVAALRGPSRHASLVLFVLFMLSSTTYDALHETFFWVSVYWQRLLPVLQPLWGSDIIQAQSALTTWYVAYQRLGLVVFPFVYLLVYLFVLACARWVTKTSVPLSTLAAQFAISLVPIALVYHATHYYTILITELPRLPLLAADPFGLGWQLFATAGSTPAPLNMGVVWHSQVALMLAGHVIAVYLAHVIALRVFPSHRQGVVSQLPMLALMVAYTCLGLWVLSLPLAIPQVLPIG